MKTVYRFVGNWDLDKVSFLLEKRLVVKEGFNAVEIEATPSVELLMPILKEWGGITGIFIQVERILIYI